MSLSYFCNYTGETWWHLGIILCFIFTFTALKVNEVRMASACGSQFCFTLAGAMMPTGWESSSLFSQDCIFFYRYDSCLDIV